MIQFPDALAAWGTDAFNDTLKQALEALDPANLPLQQAIEHGSYYSGGPVRAVVMNMAEGEGTIEVGVGLFFTSVIAGCNCADDPTPPDELQEYGEIRVVIRKGSGEAEIALAS